MRFEHVRTARLTPDLPVVAYLLERLTATTCLPGPGRERPPLVRSCPWGIASSRGRAVPMYHLIDDRDLEEGR